MPLRRSLPKWVLPSSALISGSRPSPVADHADYLAAWLKVLQADSRAIFTAAAQAQRAAGHRHFSLWKYSFPTFMKNINRLFLFS